MHKKTFDSSLHTTKTASIGVGNSNQSDIDLDSSLYTTKMS